MTDQGDAMPREVLSDWDTYRDGLETPTPASLRCVVCRFEVVADEVAIALIHGVICVGCRARVMGEPDAAMPKSLRLEISRIVNDVKG